MGLKQVFQSVANLLAPFTLPQGMPAALNARKAANVSTLPSGFPALDKALEIGGLPYGKIIELIGSGDPTMSDGTTCLAARMAAKVQRRQGLVTIVDMNRSFDSWQAERCGLTTPELFLAQPETILDALLILERAAHSSELVVIIMGVVANLLGDIEPDLLTTLLRRLYHIIRQSGSVYLFLTTPSADDPFSPENYPVGFPLDEVADMRLWVQEEGWTIKNGLTTAYKANLTVIKNSLGLVGKGANLRVKLSNF